jgi:hypothetical protein
VLRKEKEEAMVTESELSEILRSKGWTLVMQQRYKTRYASAKRRYGKIVKSRYISTENKLSQLSAEDILKKIGD